MPVDHVEIARRFSLIDTESAAESAGSRFYYLTNEAALLEMALVQWALQFLVKRGFTPVLPPDVARTAVIEV